MITKTSIVLVDLTEMINGGKLNTETEEGEYTNLLLNMMGGLTWEDLTKEEQDLMKKFGYNVG